MEPKMIEGLDYCYIYPKEDKELVHVKILDGEYKDTVFKYGRVGFEEKNDQVHLQFNFNVLESTVMDPKVLEKTNDFKNYIGDLLVEIMSSNIEQEIIDETGTSYTEEPHL
jgi:hypothetical protein